MSENNGDLGAFLAGFVIGSLVGAATALILAPQSGQEMRSQLAERGQSLREVGGERFHQYREVASTSLSGTRERMQEVGSQVQEQARIVLDTGRGKAQEMAPTQDKAETAVSPTPSTDAETPDTTETTKSE